MQTQLVTAVLQKLKAIKTGQGKGALVVDNIALAQTTDRIAEAAPDVERSDIEKHERKA